VSEDFERQATDVPSADRDFREQYEDFGRGPVRPQSNTVQQQPPLDSTEASGRVSQSIR